MSRVAQWHNAATSKRSMLALLADDCFAVGTRFLEDFPLSCREMSRSTKSQAVTVSRANRLSIPVISVGNPLRRRVGTAKDGGISNRNY